jgi:hypothetical protein
MNSKQSLKDYDILGYRVKLRSDEDVDIVSPDEVVEYVREMANDFLMKSPGLSRGEAALLVALSMAQDKLILEKDFKENVDVLQQKAAHALKFIEEVSPTSVV